MNKLLALGVALLCCAGSLFAQENCVLIPQSVTALATDQPGGLYLPSRGSLHALIIFAQFPDDNYETSNPKWPLGQAPSNMNQWVDAAWTGTPTPGTLTDYYSQMSMGQFKFTGETRSLTVQHDRQWYINNGMDRADIHAEIIQTLDATMDFADFDRWDPEDDYVQLQQADKIVDLVVVIWRNIANDKSSLQERNNILGSLGFGLEDDNGNFPPTDFAALGYKTKQGQLRYIPVDIGNGNRRVGLGSGIDKSTREPGGAGATIVKNYLHESFPSMMKVVIHEIAHHLLGHNNWHVGFGYWGMLSAYGSRNFVPNSFERHRLGWITLTSLGVTPTTLTGLSLPDYITTGVAYRYLIDPATHQYFYIENHQGISYWDKAYKTDLTAPMERGVYVLRQDKLEGTDGDASQGVLVPADGRYDWVVNRRETSSCCGATSLAVFKQLAPNRHNGWHDCDKIPYIDPVSLTSKQDDIVLMEDANGNTMIATKFAGDGQDAFRMGYQQVFSPWSNPSSVNAARNSTGFGFEITGVQSTANGDVYTIDLYSQTAVAASPAKIQAFKITASATNKAQLSWQANEEPDLQSYKIYRSTVVGVAEPAASSFQLIATINAKDAQNNPVTSWTDNNSAVGTSSLRQYYKISAVDNTGKESVKSVSWIYTAELPPGGGSGKQGAQAHSGDFQCSVQVFPNPVNDEIHFSVNLPADRYITLQLFDAIGNMVATVVSSEMTAGEHTLHYHTTGLQDGCYIYRLQAGTANLSGTIIIKKQ